MARANTMNLRELRSLAFSRADEVQSSVYPATFVTQLINIGLAKVAELSPDSVFAVLADRALAVGETDIHLPDLLEVDGLSSIEYVRVNGADVSYSATAHGITIGAAVDGDTIVVKYPRYPLHLNTDTDVPGVTLDAADLAVTYAVYQMKLKDDEYGAADRWKARFDEGIRMIAGPRPGVYKA